MTTSTLATARSGAADQQTLFHARLVDRLAPGELTGFVEYTEVQVVQVVAHVEDRADLVAEHFLEALGTHQDLDGVGLRHEAQRRRQQLEYAAAIDHAGSRAV